MAEQDQRRSMDNYNLLELNNFIELLKKRWKASLVSIILFGSQVRGKAKEESDIDLLIIKKDLPKSRLDRILETFKLAKEISEDFAYKLSPILLTPDEALSTKPFYLDMIENSRILFDTDNFFFSILTRLRDRLIVLGSAQRYDEDGNRYWVLKEDVEIGEEIVL